MTYLYKYPTLASSKPEVFLVDINFISHLQPLNSYGHDLNYYLF